MTRNKSNTKSQKKIHHFSIQVTQGEVLPLFLHDTLQPRCAVRIPGKARHVLREMRPLQRLPELGVGGALTQGVQVEAQGAWQRTGFIWFCQLGCFYRFHHASGFFWNIPIWIGMFLSISCQRLSQAIPKIRLPWRCSWENHESSIQGSS